MNNQALNPTNLPYVMFYAYRLDGINVYQSQYFSDQDLYKSTCRLNALKIAKGEYDAIHSCMESDAFLALVDAKLIFSTNEALEMSLEKARATYR